MTPPEPQAYLSYGRESAEHEKRVLELANRLRQDGIRCVLHQYEPPPAEAWENWVERQVQEADFVLMFCTEAYNQQLFDQQSEGVKLGGRVLTKLIYERPTKPKLIPIVFSPATAGSIPPPLLSEPFFNPVSEQGYRRLVVFLKGKLDVEPPLGDKGNQRGEAPSPVQSNSPKDSPGPAAAEPEEDDESSRTEVEGTPFDELRKPDFTRYAWDLLQVARRIGEGRPRAEVCSARRLVAAVMLSGIEDKQGEYTGGWLLRQFEQGQGWVKDHLISLYPAIGTMRASFREILNSNGMVAKTMTPRLRSIIETARRLAVESGGASSGVRICARHLLAAALRRTERPASVGRFLRQFGLSTDEVRARLIQALPHWGVPDDLNAWRRILEPLRRLPEQEGLPTYAADSAVGPDLIGITREVEAMASLVSAWAVEPPLSIGLFGEWGSGKSFFMQKIKERVRQIASEARKSSEGQKDFGYYRNIVQVEFNAWHYVEGNLWASLVEHIFSNLRLEGTGEENVDSEEHIRHRVERLLGEVKEKTEDTKRKEEQARALKDGAEKKRQEADTLQREAEQAK